MRRPLLLVCAVLAGTSLPLLAHADAGPERPDAGLPLDAGALAGGPALIDATMVRNARRMLAERWVSDDGRLSLRLPRGFVPQATGQDGGVTTEGELGRFLAPGPAMLRVGYVAGPVRGQLDEMNKVVRNITPRWQAAGYRLEAGAPHATSLAGRAAVIAELRLLPATDGGTAIDPLSLVYAYVNHGELPGVMAQALLPLEQMQTMRHVLLASLQTLQIDDSGDANLPVDTAPSWPFPVLLCATMVVGGLLLRRARRTAH